MLLEVAVVDNVSSLLEKLLNSLVLVVGDPNELGVVVQVQVHDLPVFGKEGVECGDLLSQIYVLVERVLDHSGGLLLVCFVNKFENNLVMRNYSVVVNL